MKSMSIYTDLYFNFSLFNFSFSGITTLQFMLFWNFGISCKIKKKKKGEKKKKKKKKGEEKKKKEGMGVGEEEPIKKKKKKKKDIGD